jgi:thiol-disulfide isomerase/thioredoxin
MRKIRLGVALMLLVTASSLAAQDPPSAERVLADAKAQAAQQHKNIFLIFRASWCEPCKQLEAFIETPEIGSILKKHFVIARVSIGEEYGDNPRLNSPGGGKLLVEVGGATGGEGGVPFIVLLDAKRKFIASSNRPVKGKAQVEGIGYPTEPEEIDWFMTMLKKGAPSLTKDDAQVVEDWLRKGAGS